LKLTVWSGLVMSMENTKPAITVSRTLNTTTYESSEFGIILATVDRAGSYSWRAACYFAPDEYDEEIRSSRAAAETIALRHTQSVIDAL
jgi:hypothetical protein